jgi:hypothetical protein
LYQKKIEILKGGSSSSQLPELADPTEGLSRTLVDLNLKEAEIGKYEEDNCNTE